MEKLKHKPFPLIIGDRYLVRTNKANHGFITAAELTIKTMNPSECHLHRNKVECSFTCMEIHYVYRNNPYPHFSRRTCEFMRAISGRDMVKVGG